jgi:hypothetical protein
VAEWALKHGGKLKVVSGGEPVEVKDAAALPTVAFRVKELDLSRAKITDADLSHLGRLAELTALRLNYIPITDAGLARVHDLPSLSLHEVVETRITNDGLKHLAKLPQGRNGDATRRAARMPLVEGTRRGGNRPGRTGQGRARQLGAIPIWPAGTTDPTIQAVYGVYCLR